MIWSGQNCSCRRHTLWPLPFIFLPDRVITSRLWYADWELYAMPVLERKKKKGTKNEKRHQHYVEVFDKMAVCQEGQPLSWPFSNSWILFSLVWLLHRLGAPPHEESIFWDWWNFFWTYSRCNQLFLFLLFSTFSLWPRKALQFRIKALGTAYTAGSYSVNRL